MKCVIHLAMMLAAGVMATACGSNSPTPTAPTPTTATVTAVVVTSALTSSASFQMTATARMSDATSRDVTSVATWDSSNPLLAVISSTGMVTVVGSGEVDVRATYQNVSGSMHLLVAKVPVVAVTLSGAPLSSSSSFQVTATARLSDGSTQNVTRSATWESSDTRLAAVTAGYVTIAGNGDVDIRATYQGMAGVTHVSVSMPRTYILSGAVAEAAPNARPIVGARVEIVVADHTFTDERGLFAINGIAGRVIIEVTKAGYQTWSNEVVIDHDTQLNVTLYPTPPKDANAVSATARCNDGSWSWSSTSAAACTANGGIAYPVCPGALCTATARGR